MERYGNIVKMEEVRRLADNHQYVEAVKILKSMDFNKIKSQMDLNIMADVFIRTERYNEAMMVLTKIYKKTKTRRILYQLVDVSIKRGNIVEAEEYLVEYIKFAPNDFSRYIFRYFIDVLKNAPFDVLIYSLEQLKECEYMEMWAYELAQLYHEAGMKDKCIRECSDIVLWFGDGNYVEKAKILKRSYADAGNLIVKEEEPAITDESINQAMITDESINQREEEEILQVADIQETIEEEVFASVYNDTYGEINNCDETDKSEVVDKSEVAVGDGVAVCSDESVNYDENNSYDDSDNTGVVFTDETVNCGVINNNDELDNNEVRESMEETNICEETESMEETYICEETESLEETGSIEETYICEETDYIDETNIFPETDNYEQSKLEQISFETGINFEKILGYFTRVKGCSMQIVTCLECFQKENTNSKHLIITGDTKSGKTTLAKKMAKVLFCLNKIKTSRVALISAAKLNQINLEQKSDKLIDGALLIEEAGLLESNTVEQLLNVMLNLEGRIFVILEDNQLQIDNLLEHNTKLAEAFESQIHLSEYTKEDLFGFANYYITQNDYELSEDANELLLNRINEVESSEKAEKCFDRIMQMIKNVKNAADRRNQQALSDLIGKRSFYPTDFQHIYVEDFTQ